MVIAGEKTFPAGRVGEAPSVGLSASLRNAGFKLGRLQTGTPARLDKSTIDFSDPRFGSQPGDKDPAPFSFLNTKVDNAVRPCFYMHLPRHIPSDNIHVFLFLLWLCRTTRSCATPRARRRRRTRSSVRMCTAACIYRRRRRARGIARRSKRRCGGSRRRRRTSLGWSLRAMTLVCSNVQFYHRSCVEPKTLSLLDIFRSYIPEWPLLQFARRRTGEDVPHGTGAGKRENRETCVRSRIRPHRRQRTTTYACFHLQCSYLVPRTDALSDPQPPWRQNEYRSVARPLLLSPSL